MSNKDYKVTKISVWHRIYQNRGLKDFIIKMSDNGSAWYKSGKHQFNTDAQNSDIDLVGSDLIYDGENSGLEITIPDSYDLTGKYLHLYMQSNGHRTHIQVRELRILGYEVE